MFVLILIELLSLPAYPHHGIEATAKRIGYWQQYEAIIL